MSDRLKKVDALLGIIEESTPALEKMSESEIDKLLAAEGIDAAKASASLDAAFEKAYLTFRKSRMTKAKEFVQNTAKIAIEIASKIPTTPEKRKALLEQILNQMPQIRPALTFQNRNFQDLSDDDIKSALEAMEKLGVLDDVDKK
jgi:hypothetical protein